MDAEFRCLGRRALCAKVAAKNGDKWSNRGTKTHAFLEGKLKLEDLPPSDQDTALRIRSEESRIVEKYGFTGAERISEKRLWVLDDNMQKLYSAKPDCVYVSGKRTLVLDDKTLWGAIIAIPQNWQIKTQVACVAFNYGVEEVVGALIHPHAPDSLSQSMTFTAEAITRIQADILGYLAAMTDDAPRTPNGISCQYCASKTVCKEYQEAIAAILPLDGKIVRAPFETMTPAERGNRLRLFKMAEKVMEEERAFYVEALTNDKTAVDGWRLVPGMIRVITNPVEAFDKLCTALGDPAARTCMDISLKSLESILQQNGTKKQDIPDKIAEILGECLTKKTKKPSMKEI